MNIESCKKNAALAAITLVKDNMYIGLGSGTTIRYFLEALADKIKKGLAVTCAPSSNDTRRIAQKLDIPLFDDDHIPPLDLTIDGADEITQKGHAVKGGGGALLREKIIAAGAHHVAIIVDETKYVSQLGAFPLPVEVMPFAHDITQKYLTQYARKHHVRLRKNKNAPFITDNGNLIYDCTFTTIPDPVRLAKELDALPGVMAHGLFINLIDDIFIAKKNGDVFRQKARNKKTEKRS